MLLHYQVTFFLYKSPRCENLIESVKIKYRDLTINLIIQRVKITGTHYEEKALRECDSGRRRQER